jgi:hypothetical protein
LQSDASFRYIELLPGQGKSVVKYRLHFATFENPPPYEAISYAWGDPNLRRMSVCDGSILRITHNLYDCLQTLRYSERSRYLWADAIAIDQKNISEKNHQVQHMWHIYQKATKVIVWLGLDEPADAGDESKAELASKAIGKIVGSCIKAHLKSR